MRTRAKNAVDSLDGRLYANWDAYWDGFMSFPLIEKVRFSLIRRACDYLLKQFPLEANMDFCELGAGTAVVSHFLGNKYHVNITIVDDNQNAIKKSSKLFEGFLRKFVSIKKDLFDVKELSGCFDLVHSGGLIEHFIGDKRMEIVKVHCDLAKPNGYIMMLVPVRNVWYRILNEGIFKWFHLLDEIHEVPWSLDELSNALKKFGFEIVAKTYVISELGVLAKRMDKPA